MKSPLRILGITEGFVVIGVGVFLTKSLSSANGPLGWSIVGVGLLTVILAGFLGGQDPQLAEDPQETSEPTDKPTLALASSTTDVQASGGTVDERWVSRELDRWRWRHRWIRVRQQALRLEQYVRKHDDVLPWMTQRINELFLLADGYARKADILYDASRAITELEGKGTVPVFERMQILEQEAEKLRQDAQLYVAELQEWPEGVRDMDYAEELERIRNRLEDLQILQEQYGRMNERDVVQNAP